MAMYSLFFITLHLKKLIGKHRKSIRLLAYLREKFYICNLI